MVQVQCPNPNCGQTYQISEEELGGTATCHKCQQRFSLVAGGPTNPCATGQVPTLRADGAGVEGVSASSRKELPSRPGDPGGPESQAHLLQQADQYRYNAFISYRHVEPDRKWAKWLHSALETYRVPAKLVRERRIPARVGRVFRDEEELPASADLNSEIESALQGSKFLIVICSRRTPESEWVNKEVIRFRQLGRDERILALLIEGEPQEAFPRSLREIRRTITDGQGRTIEEIEEVEPLAADVRPLPARMESPRYLKRMARLRLLACVLGCRFDDLRQREQERRMQRLSYLSALMIALFTVMLALSGAAVYQKGQADRHRIAAETALERESDERRRAEQALYRNRIALAHSKWLAGDVGNAHEELVACPTRLRHWEWGHLERRCHVELLTLHGRAGCLRSVAFSPDGKHIASASDKGTVKIWNATTGQEVRSLQAHAEGVGSVVFSPDGRHLASASADKTAKVWDATTGEEVLTLRGHSKPVRSVAFSADGTKIATGSDGGTLRIWDAATGRELHTSQGYSGGLAFSPDGTRMASGAGILDLATGKIAVSLRGDKGVVLDVSFGPDGKRIATASGNESVQIWDANTGEEVLALRGHSYWVMGVAFSPDGKRIASSGHDSEVRIWDARTGVSLLTLQGHRGIVEAVAFSPDGTRVASAGVDGTLKVWDVSKRQESLTLLGGHVGSGWMTDVAFSPDGKRIASTCQTGMLRIWDGGTGQLIGGFRASNGGLRRFAFSPDGRRIAAGTRVWDADTGQELVTLRGCAKLPNDVAFSPDGTWIASNGHDGTLKLWDAATGLEAFSWPAHERSVECMAFSPDGMRIASAGGEGKDWHYAIKIWNAKTGQEVLRLRGHPSKVCTVAFSPDGKRLCSASHDETVRVWDASTGREVQALEGHVGAAWDSAFSPDGRRIASAHSDDMVKIWDANTGDEVFTLPVSSGTVYGVAFSPDGTRIASANRNGTVKVWEATPWCEANTGSNTKTQTNGRELFSSDEWVRMTLGPSAAIGTGRWFRPGFRLRP